MPRTTLVFSLSSSQAQRDLLHEFSLHRDLDATGEVTAGLPTIQVVVGDVATRVWEVRATVGMFDDAATEVGGQA
ncbi:hypothetical protein [Aeromicrobium stalagmiti]|uniref:hypothetical protein n=1 Tax=Aeromicrobium stalagmiti TaxID=2738988 RepID=UPI00156A108B|nr:hypothetical protein [Aeromicrobium stalagmiti]NRQ49162.1 hypothetical protein [Aeromicrobium stalagmiti]